MATTTTPTSLAEAVLVRADDASVSTTFGTLWSDKPLVAVFLRRLGCQICRVQAQDVQGINARIEELGGHAACFSFEQFGEGSDVDRSWSAGKYWTGPVWTDRSKGLYKELFQRKGIWSGFGLFDMSKERVKEVKERGVKGNFKGDGFQLAGTFVIDTDGTVVLDHRQKFYGDDATPGEPACRICWPGCSPDPAYRVLTHVSLLLATPGKCQTDGCPVCLRCPAAITCADEILEALSKCKGLKPAVATTGAAPTTLAGAGGSSAAVLPPPVLA